MPKTPDKSCAYSFETKRMYYGDMPGDRRDLVEVCGGGGEVCIIAPWSNPSKELDENGAKTTCGQIVRMGHVTLIGIRRFRGRGREEPSFAADRGINGAGVRALPGAFGQKAAYLVRHGLAESAGRGRLERQSCALACKRRRARSRPARLRKADAGPRAPRPAREGALPALPRKGGQAAP